MNGYYLLQGTLYLLYVIVKFKYKYKFPTVIL